MRDSKLDVSEIVRDHWRTLVSYRTGKVSMSDVLLFYGLPLVLAAVLLIVGVELDASMASVLITALAVFAGLLFNLLLLVHDLLKKTDRASTDARELLKQIYSSIAYSILVALLAIGILLGSVTLHRYAAVVAVCSALAFFAVLNFLLTLLMILRRIHVMLAKEFDGGAIARPG